MQNYFPEKRQGRPVSMKASEGERGWREGMRGKGVTGSIGWIIRWGQRSRVACGRGRVRTGLLWRWRTTHTCMLKHGGGSPQVTQCRHFVTPSESSGEGLRYHLTRCIYIGSILTQLHTFGLITVVCRPAQLFAFIRLAFFWGGGFPRSDTHKHSLRYTIQTEATGVKIPFDGHSNVYFSTPSLFVKLL